MAQRVAIGSDLYLFHGDDGPSDYLLISSHGVHLPNSTFRVPDETVIHFYSPRRKFLRMTIGDFTLGSTVEEAVGAGSICQNYALSKWQGSHGGGVAEDYASLLSQIDMTRRSIEHGMPPKPDQAHLMAGYAELCRRTQNLIPFDFLTIRNRYKLGMLRGNTLNNTLRRVRNAGYNHPFVFCSFCRGLLPGYDGTQHVGHH